MKFLFSQIILCCVLFASCSNKGTESGGVAETDSVSQAIVLNDSNFPDVNFRSAICRKLSIAEGDTIPNEIILKVEELRLSELGIRSLKGIEFFTALRQVDCRDNMLKEIDFSKNISLVNLECANNLLTSIDVTNNQLLEGLGCSHNKLTSIDLTKCPNLEHFLCSGNKIKHIDISKCQKLLELGVVNCELTELDVTNNPNLKKLYCSGNNIRVLDLRNNLKMDNLYCKQPFLSQIDIIRPSNNASLGKETTHYWTDYLSFIWWEK